MLRITELARQTGASIDEIHYLEKKGIVHSNKVRLKQRAVRQFSEESIRPIALIIKYRRQGFTWNVANEKAHQEINKPSLF
ncbi:MAG TPA: MerR family transcriptional regulator [Dehalococcoidales bacterium]